MHLFIALYAVWLVCSGRHEIFFLAAGAFCCAVVVMLVRRMGIYDPKNVPLYFRLRTWSYLLWLVKEIMISGVEVTRIILRRDINLSPVQGWTKSSQKTEVGLAAYATSITLTPGTVTVGAEKGRLHVHALDKCMYHTLIEDIMDKRISREMER